MYTVHYVYINCLRLTNL